MIVPSTYSSINNIIINQNYITIFKYIIFQCHIYKILNKIFEDFNPYF